MLEKIEIALIMFARPTLDVEVPNRGVASNDILVNILNTVYIIAGLVAVIAIVTGGFWYVTSNGEPDKIKRGKNAIIYSAIGIVVILMAFGITGFISSRIGV